MSSYQFVPFEWPRWAQMWTLALAIYIVLTVLFVVFTIVYAWAALQPSVAGRV